MIRFYIYYSLFTSVPCLHTNIALLDYNIMFYVFNNHFHTFYFDILYFQKKPFPTMGKKKEKKEKKADTKYGGIEQKMKNMQILGGSVPGWAYVKKANAQEDPLEPLPSFKAFKVL